MTDPEQTEKQADDKQDMRVEQVADLEAEPSDVDDVKGGPWGGGSDWGPLPRPRPGSDPTKTIP